MIERNEENTLSPNLKKLAEGYLDKYNKFQETPLDIYLFEEAIRQLCKLDRVLSLPGGNLFLLGLSGTGKKSLCKLSAFIRKIELFEFKESGLTQAQFQSQLKGLMDKMANNPNQRFAFMVQNESI